MSVSGLDLPFIGSGHATLIVVFLLGLLIAFLITPYVGRLALALGVVDRPGPRKIHKHPVPLLGGLGICAATWTPLLFLCLDDEIRDRLVQQEGRIIAIMLAGLAMLLLGVWDDMRGLSAKWKFLFQIPLAVALVLAGLSFDRLTVPGFGSVDLGPFGLLLSVVWFVGVTNAINLIDGLDGLATGVALLMAAANAIIAIMLGNILLALLMCSLAGACLGFMRYNFSPARIFLGDTGSLFLGVTLAASAVATHSKGAVVMSMLIPVMLLGYPTFDTLLAMVRRSSQGRSPFSPDLGHIHHRLLAKGLGHKKSALVIYGLNLLFALVALGAVMENNLVMAVGIVVLSASLFIVLRFSRYFGRFSPETTEQDRLRAARARHRAEAIKAQLSLATDPQEVFQLLGSLCKELKMQAFCLSPPHSCCSPGWDLYLQRQATEGGFEWRNGLSAEALPDLDQVDRFDFEDTGLRIRVYYSAERIPGELQAQQYVPLCDIFKAANDRLKELASSQQAWPAASREGLFGASITT